jgi:hypothetical protein
MMMFVHCILHRTQLKNWKGSGLDRAFFCQIYRAGLGQGFFINGIKGPGRVGLCTSLVISRRIPSTLPVGCRPSAAVGISPREARLNNRRLAYEPTPLAPLALVGNPFPLLRYGQPNTNPGIDVISVEIFLFLK